MIHNCHAGSTQLSLPERLFTVLAILVCSLLAIMPVQAAIVGCGSQVCSSSFSINFNDITNVGGGELLYDATTGVISLNLDPNSITGNGMVTQMDTLMWTMGDGTKISVDSLSGNADPILGFALGASTGVNGANISIAFNLPIALSGPISASSSVSYSLTSTTSAGAQISPFGGTNVVRAFEVDSSVGGIGPLNKGVDVGNTFFFLGGPQVQNSPVYTASNSFTGDLAYDLMGVQVSFTLSANSSVGISGFVSQTPVPVPAALWLFGSGLLGFIVISKPKKAS
jgi:hypothetical protein